MAEHAGAIAGASAAPGRGRLMLAGRRAPASAAVIRGRLLVGAPMIGAAVSCEVRPVSLRIVPRGAGVGGVETVRRGSLRIVPRGRAAGVEWTGIHGKRLAINRRPRGPAISAPKQGAGPGAAAGEFVVPLPDVWISQAFPAEYIGRDLAALALLRGEAWELAAGVLSVGGRVVIGAEGSAILYVDAADVEGWIADRYAELGRYLGALGLPPGARRDAVLTKYRKLAATAVRSGAKFARGVGDPARRAALLADLAWIERRV